MTTTKGFNLITKNLPRFSFESEEIDVIPFYAGENDVWSDHFNAGLFSNFSPLPHALSVSYQNITGTFSTTEAIYQSLKWWYVLLWFSRIFLCLCIFVIENDFCVQGKRCDS
jgi:hypothetical protein